MRASNMEITLDAGDRRIQTTQRIHHQDPNERTGT